MVMGVSSNRECSGKGSGGTWWDKKKRQNYGHLVPISGGNSGTGMGQEPLQETTFCRQFVGEVGKVRTLELPTSPLPTTNRSHVLPFLAGRANKGHLERELLGGLQDTPDTYPPPRYIHTRRQLAPRYLPRERQWKLRECGLIYVSERLFHPIPSILATYPRFRIHPPGTTTRLNCPGTRAEEKIKVECAD